MPVSEDLLRGGIEKLGLSYSPAMVQSLLAYTALLQKWDRVYNLGARASLRQPQDFLRRHVLDSLSISPLLPEEPEKPDKAGKQAVLDVGSGAGLPGLPLAVLGPRRQFILLDSDGKKTRFLQQARTELNLSNVHIVKCRVQHYHPPPRLGMVLCRAFAPLSRLAASLGSVVPPGVPLLVMLGRRPPPQQLQQIPGYHIAGVQRLAVPGLTEERHALILTKAEPT